MKIQRKQKIDWRSIIVDYVSIYSLTILVTTLIQVVIFKVDTEILLTCLLKSMLTNIVTVILVLWGLKSPKIETHPAIMAVIYTLSSIPYSDIVIMYMYMYKTGMVTVLQIFGIYFIFYFIIGFFIAKYVYYAKIILDKIIGMYTIFIPKKSSKESQTNRDPK